MITNLSILIPCYNGPCVKLVTELQEQAERIAKDGETPFDYEIIVADDGSTDSQIIAENSVINSLPNCRYIIREHNEGRSAIRNFLASEARFEWLLFIDCDMVVRNPDYLANYITIKGEAVVYGGYVINGDGKLLKNNLRYVYEKKSDRNGIAAKRMKRPYDNFHTSNFIVKRAIMIAYPLDERFRKYGYEDVIWGKTLHDNGILIIHKDNLLSFETFEDNAEFMAKTEEGIETLARFRSELKGYSSLIEVAVRLERLHLMPLFNLCFSAMRKPLKNILICNKPNIFLFNIYKLGMFCRILYDEKATI